MLPATRPRERASRPGQPATGHPRKARAFTRLLPLRRLFQTCQIRHQVAKLIRRQDPPRPSPALATAATGFSPPPAISRSTALSPTHPRPRASPPPRDGTSPLITRPSSKISVVRRNCTSTLRFGSSVSSSSRSAPAQADAVELRPDDRPLPGDLMAVRAALLKHGRALHRIPAARGKMLPPLLDQREHHIRPRRQRSREQPSPAPPHRRPVTR